jgi:Flp pilus assembly protein TadB
MTSDPATPGAQRGARGLPRPLLWVLLVVALAANAVTSISALPVAVSAAFGVLALALGALLVRDHYRRRARTTAGGPPPGRPDA